MLKNFAKRALFCNFLPHKLFARSLVLSHSRTTTLTQLVHPKSIKNQSFRFFSTEIHDDSSLGEIQNRSDKTRAEDSSFTDDEIRIKVFNCALNHVIEHGWSHRAISLGAEEVGYGGAVEEKFEENDLLMHLVRESNGKLLCYLQDNADSYKNDTNKLIRDAIEFRLRLIIPYINVWAEAMKMMLSPKLFSESTDELSKMVDDIWCYAGDQSSDLEWYIKRGALAQLYGGLQLVMLTDQSEDYKDTWTFLDQR